MLLRSVLGIVEWESVFKLLIWSFAGPVLKYPHDTVAAVENLWPKMDEKSTTERYNSSVTGNEWLMSYMKWMRRATMLLTAWSIWHNLHWKDVHQHIAYRSPIDGNSFHYVCVLKRHASSHAITVNLSERELPYVGMVVYLLYRIVLG
jgi:hypothetical protein